jgi:lipoprotein-anchoring transpeptidase ErfK/SrfK
MGIDGEINKEPDQQKVIDQGNPVKKKPDQQIDKDQSESVQENSGHEPIGDQIELVHEMIDNEPVSNRSELILILLQFWQKIYTNTILRKTIRKILFITLITIIILFIFSWFIYIVPGFQEAGKGRKPQPANISELKNDPVYRKQILQIGRDAQRLSRKFTAYTPGQSYLVINTTDNRFFLYRNKKLIREGFCSTGSYTRLTNAEGSRHWVFKTPKGRFWIQQKITSPLWIRPDWSFVEEGLPIPSKNDDSRYEYGVLGKYAMSLGDGYLIHGTIYKRLLGMPVTHGCVRLNDDDLEAINNTLNIGSKVYIF